MVCVSAEWVQLAAVQLWPVVNSHGRWLSSSDSLELLMDGSTIISG